MPRPQRPRQHRSPRKPYENLSKIDPGLQNQVLAFRTPPRAHLAHSFWRPDFFRTPGWLQLGYENLSKIDLWAPRSRFGFQNISGGLSGSQFLAPRFSKILGWTGGCKSRPQVETASQDRKSRPKAAVRHWRLQVEAASQNRKSRPQVETDSHN